MCGEFFLLVNIFYKFYIISFLFLSNSIFYVNIYLLFISFKPKIVKGEEWRKKKKKTWKVGTGLSLNQLICVIFFNFKMDGQNLILDIQWLKKASVWYLP